jgi:UDP:flavonoid glycosyltransferase YjiC (YdhE family)
MTGGQRILFVTSNGTGLGHLTRSMAIARRLGAGFEPLFFTLSQAASVVRELGFPVEYMASHGSPGAGNDMSWSRRLGSRLRAVIGEAEPAALVFDGILPYDPLLAAIKGVPLAVWCRRGLWRRGASTAPLTRSGRFDAVLEPGEFAAALDRGPTRGWGDEPNRVAPIVFCDDAELLPRDEAQRELGLEPGRTNLLVQLGQGAEVAAATARCLDALAGRDGVQVAATASAISGPSDPPDRVVPLHATYPVSRYYAAFDGAVSAAGYNAFHELIRFGVPSVFVPIERETDDQDARARHADESGVGLGASGPGDPRLEGLLEVLLDRRRREAMRERLAGLRPDNGAEEAARWLERLVGDSRAGAAPPRGRRSPRRLGPSARQGAAWLASVPRTIARLGSQTLSMPRPRTLVVALGLEGEELVREVEAALVQTPDPPEQVLVVTDSPAIGALRRLGVGVEQVPGPGDRQATLAGGDYGRFLRARLRLVLAHRPRLRRAVGVGDVPAELLDAATAPPRRRAHLLR